MIIPTWLVSCDHDRCEEFLEGTPGELRIDVQREAQQAGWVIQPRMHLCPRHARGVAS